ncbi:MAG: hypothetical protein MOIL_01620 [Candidatus Methanolliviera sp. GoM_oil]|nr:MAG: hypothetical protein MOIL_01620 [Candidatus Methanolliviera sp. GoM_oil]
MYLTNSVDPVIVVGFEGNKATIIFPTSLMPTAIDTAKKPIMQSVIVNITSNTYVLEFYWQSIRYFPIEVGYTKNFQLFEPTIGILGLSDSLINTTLQVTDRENITVNDVTYDCYKATIRYEIPSTIREMPFIIQQGPIEEHIWLRVSDLLMVRSSSSFSIFNPETGTTTDTSSETRLVSLTYE